MHVAVAGAGVVGVCCALWLQRSGHRVTLVDPNPPGSGTSSGNACTIADYGCIPVNSPALFTQLPQLLFSRNSPLSIDPLYALSETGWMLDFLNNCRRSRVDHTIAALGSILRHTYSGLDPLVKMTNAAHLFNQHGCLYVYQSKNYFDASWKNNLRRQQQDVAFEVVDKQTIQDLEPAMQIDFYKGLLFPSAKQTVNPLSLVTLFADVFQGQGGELKVAKVQSVGEQAGSLQLESGEQILADRIVISAGAYSTRIEGTGLQRLPLGTERGYHVQFGHRQSLLRRPVGWAEAGLYATPTNEGLRLAGTVEIAGLDKPANPRRLDYMTMRAKQLFELEEQPDQTWLGFRPTLPDALPVIGSGNSGRIIHAFGHHHIGLTLAGITGKLVAEIVDGKPPSVNLEPYSVARFGRRTRMAV